MARKSAAALAVVPKGKPDSRTPAPDDLNEAERAMWAEIVDTKPADWFDLDSVPVLKEYIRAAMTCDRLAGMVEEVMAEGDGRDVKTVLDMRDKEARRVASLATKLRLTQQSRYTPQSAATANRKAGGKRPWQS